MTYLDMSQLTFSQHGLQQAQHSYVKIGIYSTHEERTAHLARLCTHYTDDGLHNVLGPETLLFQPNS